MITITAIYAAILALLFIALSRNTIKARRSARVSIGDGGNDPLHRHIRAHGNFAEYVPIALLLVAFAEIQGASFILVHCLGAALVLARLAHAYGLTHEGKTFRLRVFGVVTTFLTLVSAALINLVLSFKVLLGV